MVCSNKCRNPHVDYARFFCVADTFPGQYQVRMDIGPAWNSAWLRTPAYSEAIGIAKLDFHRNPCLL